jgi:hypothetical protein
VLQPAGRGLRDLPPPTSPREIHPLLSQLDTRPEAAIKTAYADKLERDLAIGAGLLQIFRRKLYRGKQGGRKWEQWLEDESAELTAGRGRIEQKTSEYLRGFYQFRCEVLQPWSTCSSGLPLPTSPAQVRPLLGQLDTHPEAAIEMWKAAVSDAKGKVPTFDQVNRAALAYKANAANEARRLSDARIEPPGLPLRPNSHHLSSPVVHMHLLWLLLSPRLGSHPLRQRNCSSYRSLACLFWSLLAI